MVPDKLPDLRLEDIIGETMIQNLDRRDSQIRQCYLTLHDPKLSLFERLLHLHSRLMLSMANQVPGFVPRFARPSSVQEVVVTSAVGSFRNLRVAQKLLLEGYFAEMHGVLRMVEQWLECAVVVEAFPEAAGQILEHGMQKQYVGEYRHRLSGSNTELGQLYRAMRRSFHKLSQRAHPLPTAFRLMMRKGPKGMDLFLGGISSEEMFAADALALAGYARNALLVLRRHFQEVPPDWDGTFEDTSRMIKHRDKTAARAR